MRIVQTTEANADALSASIDKAFGYPRAGVLGPSRVRRDIQPTWDGIGQTPFGWTRAQCVLWRASAADTWLELDDATHAAAVASGRLTAGELTSLNAAAAARVTVADAGLRQPKESAAVAAEETKL